jgi:hypothetical protein
MSRDLIGKLAHTRALDISSPPNVRTDVALRRQNIKQAKEMHACKRGSKRV